MAMEAGKAFLRQTNADGVSVYSHITEVLAHLLETQPANALDAFESMSLARKSAHYAPGKVVVGKTPTELPGPDSPAAPGAAWCSSTQTMLKAAAKPSEDEATGTVANVMMEASMFQCAGVGLSTDETYRVYVSLNALQKEKDLASVRFFGKVLGVPTDYYVAEAVYNTPPEPDEGEGEPPPPPPGAPAEETGTGCNKYVYFATTNPAAAWTVLPDVTPYQIICSKRIRKYLTGDLTADVRAYPPFPGKEKEYLRALVARIVAATTLCPVGKFSLGEEGEGEPAEVEIGEDGRSPIPAAALGELAGWCTQYMGILDIGRCTNLPIEEEEAEGDDKPKAPEPQPEIKYLSPISADEWTATTYSHGGPPVAVARSLLWPGAHCAYQLAKGGRECLASIYIGYGLPTLSAPFVMEAPPPFEEEPADVHEQADMALEEENAIFLDAEKARVAEEAANLPDPEE